MNAVVSRDIRLVTESRDISDVINMSGVIKDEYSDLSDFSGSDTCSDQDWTTSQKRSRSGEQFVTSNHGYTTHQCTSHSDRKVSYLVSPAGGDLFGVTTWW